MAAGADEFQGDVALRGHCVGFEDHALAALQADLPLRSGLAFHRHGLAVGRKGLDRQGTSGGHRAGGGGVVVDLHHGGRRGLGRVTLFAGLDENDIAPGFVEGGEASFVAVFVFVGPELQGSAAGAVGTEHLGPDALRGPAIGHDHIGHPEAGRLAAADFHGGTGPADEGWVIGGDIGRADKGVDRFESVGELVEHPVAVVVEERRNGQPEQLGQIERLAEALAQVAAAGDRVPDPAGDIAPLAAGEGVALGGPTAGNHDAAVCCAAGSGDKASGVIGVGNDLHRGPAGVLQGVEPLLQILRSHRVAVGADQSVLRPLAHEVKGQGPELVVRGPGLDGLLQLFGRGRQG